MITGQKDPRFGPDYTPVMVTAIAGCSAAIARLDARNSTTSVASAWQARAAWAGYARALQLQSAEVDEIDVFSWGCGLQIPGRKARATNEGLFDALPEWEAALRNPDLLAWRDGLPTTIPEPKTAADHPPLVRAIEQVRRHAAVDRTILPWLGLPFALRDLGLTRAALAGLVGGAKAFRLKRHLSTDDWLSLIRALETMARAGLDRLDALERQHRAAQRAITAEYRPGALPALLALAEFRPLLSPQSVADTLKLSVAGASKLLDRATAADLMVEITQRRSWRLFLVPDLAVEMGFIAARRGRPRKEPPSPPASRDLAQVYDAFDAEMARIDALLAKTRR